MVGEINFNPNTGNPFSVDEISKIDLDGDGKISQNEWDAAQSWLVGGADSDGDVKIGENNLFENAKKAGAKETAQTEAEFKDAMSIVVDEYQEMYFTQNKGMTSAERTAMQELISTSFNAFISEYIAANPKGPWSIKDAAAEFEAKMEQNIAAQKTAKTNVDNAVTGYTENKDTNLNGLLDLAVSSNENGNISLQEWNLMKNKAVQYMMGMLLSGETNSDLLKNLDSNYETNQYYKTAVKSVNDLKDCQDPQKMQELMTEAINNITRFVEGFGKVKLANVCEDYAKSKDEEKMKGRLDVLTDRYKERNITASMSDKEKEYMTKFLETCVNKFMAKVAEAGKSYDSYSDAQLESEFNSYLNQQMAELKAVQTRAAQEAGDIETTFKSLVSVSDSAGSNGNVSADEKAKIIEAANKLIISQLMSGVEDITLLSALNPNYKSTSDFTELQGYITSIKSSADPDEIKELQEKASALITKMLDKFSGDALVKGVDATKPVEVDDSTKGKIINSSSISSDYQANVSRSTSRGKQDEGRLEEIQNMAKQDLTALAESLKAQMKAQLGSAYNEEEIQKFINDAINDTISVFTQNVSRRNGHGNYNTGSDEQAFVFLRRSGTKKGRYVYNLQSLVNTFMEKFNENAKTKTMAKLDPSQVTYDKENALTESGLNNEYDRDTKVQNKDKSALIATAKAKLQAFAAAMKSSLIAEGCKLSITEIDAMIDESIMETMDKYNFNFDPPKGNVWNNPREWFPYMSNRSSFNTKDLIDTFTDKFDAKFEKAKQKS